MTEQAHARRTRGRVLGVTLAVVFATLYGSGFVGAKYGLPYAEPFSFLTLRFAIVAVVLTAAAAVLRRPWPASPKALAHQAVAGALLLWCFSAGVFVAIHRGLPPAVAALVISLQPLIVGLVSPRLLGETIRLRQYCGLVLGFIGVSLVLGESLVWAGTSWFAAAAGVVGLIGVTGGNLYQKKFCTNMDLITGGAVQTASAAVLCALGALLTETRDVQWTPAFLVALAWMAGGVSICAMTILYVLLRRNDASRVASVFYLVPVSAAVVSFFVHGNVPGPSEIIGASVVALGVVLVTYTTPNQQPARERPPPGTVASDAS